MNNEQPPNPPRDDEAHSNDEPTFDALVRSALVVETPPPAMRDRQLDAALAAFDAAAINTATINTATINAAAPANVTQLHSGAMAPGRRSRFPRTVALVAVAAAVSVFGAIGVRAFSSTEVTDSRAGSARPESTQQKSSRQADPQQEPGSVSGQTHGATTTGAESVELPAPSQEPAEVKGMAASAADAASPNASPSLVDLGSLAGPTEIRAAVASLGSPSGTDDLTALGPCAASVRTGTRVIARATTSDEAVLVIRTPTASDGNFALAVITLSNCVTRQL